MPLSYEIKDGILFTTAVGRVTREDTLAVTRSWMRDPDLPNPILLCRDLRRLDVENIEAFEVRLSARAGAAFNPPPGSRLAFVVDSDAAYGLSRMFAMSEDFPFPVEVFRDRDAAVAWLKAEDADCVTG